MSTAVSVANAQHFIDGREVPSVSGRTFASIDPSTGGELAQVAFGEATDVDAAVAAAKRTFESGAWSKLAPAERARRMRRLADLIHEHADRIGAIESRDTGKPLGQAVAEVHVGADFITYFASHGELPDGRTHPADAGYFVYSKREPYGVVGAISPWNYPFLLACWKTAPALAVGNSVVLKMAEQTPLSTSELAKLTLEAGLPAGTFNVVHGDGPTTGASLVAHPHVPKLTFTGSTTVGQAILRSAADHVKSVHLELGGKTPNLVFADADLEQAIAGSLFTAFYNTGQICTSGSRLLVQRSNAEEVIDRFVQRARGITVGDPGTAGTQLGPLISAEQHERVTGYISEGLRGGARLALGGGRASVPVAGGYYVEPTIFVDVTPDMRIAKEEIFGPVLSVLTFEDEDEAIRIANDTMYGLAATVWTTDLRRAFRVAEKLDAGIIWTNCPHYLPVNVPYEGHKLSGLGEDLGVEALNTFTHLKTHCINFGGGAMGWGVTAPSTAAPAATGSPELAAIRALFHPAPGSVYLDTATYGLPPQPTVDAVQHALAIWQAGTARWIDDWDRPADETRGLFGALVGAPEARVARIPQASVGAGLVAAGLGPGDEVVVPDDEFTSTLFPLLVAEGRGATIRQVPLAGLVDAIRPSTTLVAASLVQMQTGRLLDLGPVLDAAEGAGAQVLIDGTQGIPFVPLEGVIDRIDYLVCSGYKHLLCPRGVSFLVVREDRWASLQPLNANWRAADEPFQRYFGGPLTLADDARRFDVSMGWIAWAGALASLRLLVDWKRAGILAGVPGLARELADRLGVPWAGSTLVSAPIGDGETARVALEAAGVKAAHRGTGIRFAPHVWTSPQDIAAAAGAIAALVAR